MQGSMQATLTFRASAVVSKSLKFMPRISKIFGLVSKLSLQDTVLRSSWLKTLVKVCTNLSDPAPLPLPATSNRD